MSACSRRLCPRGPAPRPSSEGCFRPDIPPRLPDPGIYSQAQRFSAGADFTFANPDISKSAKLSPTGEGLEVTERRVAVAVTNFSDDAPAAGVQVHIEGARWGIGMPRVPIGAFTADLGMSSSPNARVSQTMEYSPDNPFSTFFVRVMHPKDRDTSNNEGIDAQLTKIVEAGAFSLPFSVRNPLQRPVRIDLGVMTTDWEAAVSPGSLDLTQGQAAVTALTGNADLSGMTPSDRIEFTVIATVDGALLGGLTYRLGPSSG